MRERIIQLAERRQHCQNPGLVLQRYLTAAATGSKGDPTERHALLDATISATRDESLRKIYAAAYTRWKDSFPNDDLNPSEVLSTQGRLIVGLGSENVLETGIRLDHTYGVPIIPGSALKGVASHYCHDIWGQRHIPTSNNNNRFFRRGERYHRLLFGTTEDGGVMTFHDAWITPQSLSEGALRLDVMTPHHPKWQTNEAPPTDFDSPKPVSFLSVAGTFEVCVSWSGPGETEPEQARVWTQLAMSLLREALAKWGVGGKTSSGYGRLVLPGTVRSTPEAATPTHGRPANLPRTGESVEAQLIEERTKKGGWKALHEPSGLTGPIQNTRDVPGDKMVGETLNLIIAIATDREIAFRYPTAADERRVQPSRGKAMSDPNHRTSRKRGKR